MINKVIKNIKWEIAKKKMKYAGNNSKVGLDFSVAGYKYISIGNNFRGGKHIIIDAIDKYNGKPTGYIPNLCIGNNVTLTNDCYISCCNEVNIGDGCLFGANTFVCDNSHGNLSKEEQSIIPAKRTLFSKGPVHIGRNVWVGKNVCIMPGVTIGDYAVIGANSVVTHDVEQGSIVAGAPARVIRKNIEL